MLGIELDWMGFALGWGFIAGVRQLWLPVIRPLLDDIDFSFQRDLRAVVARFKWCRWATANPSTLPASVATLPLALSPTDSTSVPTRMLQSSGVITPDACPQFSGAHGVLAYFQPGQWTVHIEERRQQEHFGEDVNRIRGGGVLSWPASVFVCESREWDGKSRNREILHAGWIDPGIEMGFGVEKQGRASQPPGRTCREDRHDMKLACKWDVSIWQRWLIHSRFHPTATSKSPAERWRYK